MTQYQPPAPLPTEPQIAQEPQPVSYQPQQPRTQLPTTLAYTNTFSLVAIVLVFFQPVAGIVFGHLALGQIKRNGDTGRGLALTSVIVGYAMVAMWIMIVLTYLSIIMMLIATFPGFDPYYYDSGIYG